MKKQRQKKRGLLFVISGPSGSGKTTLREALLSGTIIRRQIAKSVSLTTRPRRSGERMGRDYFFVSKKEFLQKRRQKQLLEWTRYLGHYYATPKDFLARQLAHGKHIILCLDSRGARSVKRIFPRSAVTIFVMPPDLTVLEARIMKRCSRTRKEEVACRLALARRELVDARHYDYCVLNENLTEAVQILQRIIIEKINR